MNDDSKSNLIVKHGGYRQLKSFQLAQLVFDITVRFCDTYISKKSRTHDQMVQAARSGVQNIAEGSQASGTSKKTELKLTNVARASLEELKLDYEDFLRQRNLPLWDKDDPRRQALVKARCQSASDIAIWVKQVHDTLITRHRQAEHGHDGQNGQKSNGQDGQQSSGTLYHDSLSAEHSHVSLENPAHPSISSIKSIESISSIPSSPATPETYSTIAANAALVLIGVACSLLDRQLRSLADSFVKEGGFTERLYKVRQNYRNKQS
jgi:four helix bundle suffix protein